MQIDDSGIKPADFDNMDCEAEVGDAMDAEENKRKLQEDAEEEERLLQLYETNCNWSCERYKDDELNDFGVEDIPEPTYAHELRLRQVMEDRKRKRQGSIVEALQIKMRPRKWLY